MALIICLKKCRPRQNTSRAANVRVPLVAVKRWGRTTSARRLGLDGQNNFDIHVVVCAVPVCNAGQRGSDELNVSHICNMLTFKRATEGFL
mmetsp:Transcript_11218/g.34357  ORF Transcript_11218/g.34357 Transcript_11218/m.34357 type:complete len:91 (+) Transcript_11218:2810-3082(+)